MKWFYVYEIVYKDFMKYLGYRGCYGHPELDYSYLGSSNYTPDEDQVLFKNILYITRDEAKAYEAETWHLEYVDARNNLQYYNQHNNECFGFYSSEQVSEHMKAMWADPDSVYNLEMCRQKMGEARKAMWEDPNSKANSEESRQKRSESLKAVWADEEYKQKMSKSLRDKRLWHFYNNGKLVVSTTYNIRENSKQLFGLSNRSVSDLKKYKKQIKGWSCLGVPHQIVKWR